MCFFLKEDRCRYSEDIDLIFGILIFLAFLFGVYKFCQYKVYREPIQQGVDVQLGQ